MCQYLDVVPPGRDENRRHTRGYVEDFRMPLTRKRSVQIESKIAQFRYWVVFQGEFFNNKHIK
jgi:hypothetical protein